MVMQSSFVIFHNSFYLFGYIRCQLMYFIAIDILRPIYIDAFVHIFIQPIESD